ncbi:hypothetical protein NP233_g13102 [Leucocoprinus birnbaumii]|uniref:FAD/NAD(P)-binding domain-containing protein n=1 Tax=Leucocoprinus birnbaumii TaxID=56174 RepID=A0AAD5VDH3_9AGAR|nr:hypothetical protein NP233_g13102 [Leucocoprinus birnbaumii]
MSPLVFSDDYTEDEERALFTLSTPARDNSTFPSLSVTTGDVQWPVKRIAIIGAGVGGMTAYRELKRDGFDVHIFERDTLPGGTWHYTEEKPVNAPIPNAPIAIADFQPSLPPQGVQLPYSTECRDELACTQWRRAHRAPRAIWKSLFTNTAAPLQQIRGFSWPDGTEWAVPQAKVGRYLRSFASWNGINTNDNSEDISYNTRVELVEERVESTGKQVGWTLTTKRMDVAESGLTKVTWDRQDFDAIVVASGQYNSPNIPDIEGLQSWATFSPSNISHSRQYRHPEEYVGKSVLIVGAAASGSQISRDMSPHAASIYQSVRPERNAGDANQRPTVVDWVRQLPLNVSVVAEIKCFLPPNDTIHKSFIQLDSAIPILSYRITITKDLDEQAKHPKILYSP